MNPWLLLIAAGFFEIGWPLGFKLAQTAPGWRVPAIALSVVSMAVSGWLLFMAQKHIPIGTAYAVWTGIGAVGAAVVGVAVYGEPATAVRAVCILLIVAGIVGLKLFSGVTA